jgi:tRNA 2-thiouridine synthesizing protein A
VTEPDLLLDSRGRRCPLPVIDLARALPGVPVGGVLAVLADDPAAAVDIPAWCRLRGHDYLGVSEYSGTSDSAPDAFVDDAVAYRVRRVS